MLTGNYLLARADLLSTLEQRKTLLLLMSRSVSLMCHGETLQQGKRYDLRTTEHDYLRFNFLKLPVFSGLLRSGRIIGAASPEQLRGLRRMAATWGRLFRSWMISSIILRSRTASANRWEVIGQGW